MFENIFWLKRETDLTVPKLSISNSLIMSIAGHMFLNNTVAGTENGKVKIKKCFIFQTTKNKQYNKNENFYYWKWRVEKKSNIHVLGPITAYSSSALCMTHRWTGMTLKEKAEGNFFKEQWPMIRSKFNRIHLCVFFFLQRIIRTRDIRQWRYDTKEVACMALKCLLQKKMFKKHQISLENQCVSIHKTAATSSSSSSRQL